MCAETLEQNAAHRVKLVTKLSTEMEVGEGKDMPEKAHLLVSEIFGTGNPRKEPRPRTPDPGPQTPDPRPQTSDPRPQTPDPRPWNCVACARQSKSSPGIRELSDLSPGGREMALGAWDLNPGGREMPLGAWDLLATSPRLISNPPSLTPVHADPLCVGVLTITHSHPSPPFNPPLTQIP